MTFESGGQGLWSTLDDYLAFARMLLRDPEVPALLRGETLAMMTSNQLTPGQRAAARMFGRSIFAAGHGYGMGVAVVLEPEKADPLRCRGGVGTIGLAWRVRRLVAGRPERSIGADLPVAQHARTVADGAWDRSRRVERDRELSRDRDVVSRVE